MRCQTQLKVNAVPDSNLSNAVPDSNLGECGARLTGGCGECGARLKSGDFTVLCLGLDFELQTKLSSLERTYHFEKAVFSSTRHVYHG